MIISFFTTRVTLQVLGVNDYGLNNLVGSVVALFSFLNLSMGTAVQRFFNIAIGKGDNEKLGKIYGVGLYLHIIVAIISVTIGEIFAFVFLSKMNIPEERLFAARVVFQISIFSMALTIVNVPNYALLKAREMFDKMAMVEIVQAVLRLVVLLFLYIISYDKLILFSTLNLGVTLYYVGSLFFMAKKFEESHHRPCRDRQLVSEMLKFISFLLLTVLAELGRKQGLVMLINLFFGLAINAAYAIAVQVSHVISTFVINIKQPMIPQMMAAYGAGDKKAMFNLINFGTKITAMMMMVMTLPVIFEIDCLLELWLKNPPQYTTSLVILVLINANIASFTYFLYQGVHATGNITRQQIWMSSLYVLNVILIYVVFKLGFDFYFALYVTIVISISQCVLNLVMAKFYFGYEIRHFVSDILIPFGIVVLITSSALFLIIEILPHSIWRLILVVLVGISLCLSSGYYIMFDKDERTKSMAFVKNMIKR